MTDLITLLSMEIPEGRSSLLDSHTNLERVAEYCEGNYLQTENKRNALEETKNYTTQSLASVAYQINTLAFSFLQMLDLQATQMSEMESQVDHINQLVMVHKEKVARREIGVLTATKVVTRQYKILAPANPERPIKYVRRPIDFNALDEIGHGVRVQGSIPRQKQRASSQSSSTSLMGAIVPGAGARNTSNSPVPPAPTSKPPTPPQLRAATGSLTKASREYRTPPAVAPPQVPSNYAANYPLGHPRRASERLSGYSTLPLPHNAPHNTSQSSLPGMSINTQVGLVHPIPQGQYSQYGPGINMQQEVYSSGLERQRSLSSSNPPPPSPGLMDSMMGVMNSNMGNMGDYGTVSAAAHRPGKASPPLPPPPDEQYGPSQGFRRGVLPQEQDLPGWVPKNYVEKVVAIYDYYADKDDELSFQENSVIYVLRKNDDGWWEGVMDGITGLFPGNYVEPCM